MSEPTVAPIVTRTSGNRRRELMTATVGSVVESFDWNVYAVLAPFFAVELFGDGGGVGGLLAAYAGFAVGFAARPLGSILVGRISDTRGRRFGLTLSMAVIATASLGLALVPSAATVGVWAAVLAVAIRLVQGLAYGGEAPTVAAYVTETAPLRRRFLYSAISYGGIIIGTLLSFAVLAAMYAAFGADGLAHGGWRWGFVVAALLGLAAVWVRRCAPETEEFEREREVHGTSRPSLVAVFREHRWALVTVFLFALGSTVTFYFGLVYLPVYASQIGATGKEFASSFMTVVLVVVLMAMLMVGAAADRFGLLRVMRAGFGATAALSLPLLTGLDRGWIPFPAVALVYGVLVATSLAPLNVFLGLLFPTAVRAVGVGVVQAATVGLFGGTLPMLAESLRGAGLYGAFPFYITLCSLALLACTVTATRVPGFVEAVRQPATVKETANVIA